MTVKGKIERILGAALKESGMSQTKVGERRSSPIREALFGGACKGGEVLLIG